MFSQVLRRSSVVTMTRRSFAAASTTKLFINGKFVESAATKHVSVLNPATQEEVTRVPLALQSEMEAATAAAAEAFKTWRDTPVGVRARIMLKYQDLIKRDQELIAANIVEEQGKTLADARGDVFRGVEVVEHAANIGSLLMGETLKQVATNVDIHSFREPLGVCAGICPFNFPAMIPLWMFPLAIACGNTFVLKPSEKDPGAAMMLAKLAQEAGVPDGVLNVIHGSHDAVNFICDAPEIKAISFVGSNTAGEHIHARASALGKRVQSNMAAKNHGIILPDAPREHTVNALVGAAFGAAGQRCMALPVAVFVGETKQWIPDIVKRAKELTVGAGISPSTDIGPMIDKAAMKRCVSLITSGVEQGATLELDGRGVTIDEFPKGNFVGPTILSGVTPDMECYKQEIFGPVQLIVCVDTFEEALALVNANAWGNGAALFTGSGAAARHFEKEAQPGLLGVNTAIPVPLPQFSFTSSKASFLGNAPFYGKYGVQFYTQTKTVTSTWSKIQDVLAMPQLK